MTENEEALWRNRFILINLLRIGATALVLFALVLWQTDFLVRGGTIVLGLPLALAGLVVAFWGPKWLSRHWKRQDGR
jgi:protein-S-isoprenylcysteine O-methyltransferase Ste14